MENSKKHWENIYETKRSSDVSWTQEIPQPSLDFIHSFDLSKDSAIIDIGGGESKLVDFLLDEGFTDITVLDISEHALKKAKERLGKQSLNVQWIVSDITEFVPMKKYQVWHDRATFHFLTSENQIARYISLASTTIDRNGFMILGTFSEQGPTTCSGLEIRQYSEPLLRVTVKGAFEKIRCINVDHETPFHTVQNFLFCGFRKTE